MLAYLLANQERVVGRDELIEHVWFNRIVSDDPINRSISILRSALTPDDRQAFIKTVPRKGYIARFPMVEMPVEDTPAADTAGNAKRLRPGLILAVGLLCVLAFLLAYEWYGQAPPTISPPRLVVLPFTHLSQDNSRDYLAEGMSDTLIHMVSRVDGLEVTGRTSSFAFRGRDLTISQIAKELEVDYILDGSVQFNRNSIRVLARLVDADTDKELWSENFSRAFDDIFAIQDDIAHALVISLKGTLLETGNNYEPEFDTYQAVLKREFDINTYTHIYPSEAQFSILEEVESLVARALELDPLSSAAHNLHAMMMMYHGQQQEAGNALQRALQLDPNNAQAMGDYAM